MVSKYNYNINDEILYPTMGSISIIILSSVVTYCSETIFICAITIISIVSLYF